MVLIVVDSWIWKIRRLQRHRREESRQSASLVYWYRPYRPEKSRQLVLAVDELSQLSAQYSIDEK